MNEIGLKKQNNAARTVTAAALISIFGFSFVMSLTGVIVNEIIDSFSLLGASQGLLGSALSTGLMLALLVTPMIQGRAGKLTMIFFSCVLQAVMLFVCGLSPSFLFFCVTYVFLGVGGGLLDAYANSSILDVCKNSGPKYLGYLHGLYGVGSLIAPVAIYRMMLLTGWRGVHYVLAIAMMAAAMAVFFLSRRADQQSLSEATREYKLNKSDLLEYVRNKHNIVLILAGVFASAAQNGILIWTVRYMTMRFNAAELGVLSISVFWVCATINRFLVARIRVAPMKLFIYGALLNAVFLAVGVLAASPVIMCVMMGAIGFSSGHFIPVIFNECAIGYEGKTTFTTSLIMFIMGIVRILVPLVLAYVSTQTSPVTGMMLPVGAVLLAAVFGILTVREDSKRTLLF